MVNQLPQIAKLAVKTGAGAVNFLAFNPFEDQAKGGKRSGENVPRYTEVKPKLTEALDVLDQNNVETNVRYFPLCMAEERHRKSFYNFQQLSYDHHEWDYASWAWTGMQPQRMREGPPTEPIPMFGQKTLWPVRKLAIRIAQIPGLGKPLVMIHRLIGRFVDKMRNQDSLYREMGKLHAHLHSGCIYTDECNKCSLKPICDGFHGDYASLFTADEAKAVVLPNVVTDPKFYISKQKKLVEVIDEAWALPT